VRLHDCHWPNPDVVDIHALFPSFTRDPARAESYDFARTDEYIAAVKATGADVVFRLGESIEHERIRKFVHPPPDPEQWARICLGIIRHYNEGWANGHRHRIQYWEIWNEPDNRPACWTGTDEQFLTLYATAARAIKSAFPALKVGGPGFGYTGDVNGDSFRAGGLFTNFLAFCQRERLPLDFLSWHCYTDNPGELVVRARGIRALLDAHGFTKTESHLNEWNYLPGNTWSPISKTKSNPESRRRFHTEMFGAPGAAFIAAALIQLQDAPLDMANLFHGEVGGFGLFDEYGAPQKNYFAMQAFSEMVRIGSRVPVTPPGSVQALAAADHASGEAAILLSHTGPGEKAWNVTAANLPWPAGKPRVRLIDAANAFVEITTLTNNHVRFASRGPAIALITFLRANNPRQP
jgi:xylan 1,4-beta-xylosidase